MYIILYICLGLSSFHLQWNDRVCSNSRWVNWIPRWKRLLGTYSLDHSIQPDGYMLRDKIVSGGYNAYDVFLVKPELKKKKNMFFGLFPLIRSPRQLGEASNDPKPLCHLSKISPKLPAKSPILVHPWTLCACSCHAWTRVPFLFSSLPPTFLHAHYRLSHLFISVSHTPCTHPFFIHHIFSHYPTCMSKST